MSTAASAKAICRKGLRPSNIKMVVCELNVMQAKFLCDKSLVMLGQAIMARAGMYKTCMESVDRKMGRVDNLLTRVVCMIDQHATHPYMRGRVEEIIAGKIAVHVFQKLASQKNSWPSLQDLHQQTFDGSVHFRRALHAYAEGSLLEDTARLAVIWRLSAILCAAFARDLHGLLDHFEQFNEALAACKAYYPNYEKSWVIKKVFAVVNRALQILHPAVALIRRVSR